MDHRYQGSANGWGGTSHTGSHGGTPKTPQMEASDMLASALEQIDGILAESKREYEKRQNGSLERSLQRTSSMNKKRAQQDLHVNQLIDDLQKSLKPEEPESPFQKLPTEKQPLFKDWLEECEAESTTNGLASENLEDKIRKLESDKESLVLQVSVLTDQVEAQSEKIRDLESACDDNHGRLQSTEQLLEDELISKNSLETHKLDLMAEISTLQIRLQSSEKDRREIEEKLNGATKRINDLQGRLNDKTIEVTELRAKLAKNGTISYNADAKDTEVEKLKKAVETLMITNNEKDRHIEELNKMIKKYRRMEELISSVQGRKALEAMDLDYDQVSNTSSTQNSTSSGAQENTIKDNNDFHDQIDGHPRFLPNPSATSTPVNAYDYSPRHQNGNGINGSNLVSPLSNIAPHTPQRSNMVRSNSCEDIGPASQRMTDTGRGNFGTMPNQPTKDFNNVADVKPIRKTQTETDEEAMKDEMAQEYKAMQLGQTDFNNKKKQKGIKRFFGKLKRSSSQDLDNEKLGEFKRSGLRATAGPRLGWSKDIKYAEQDVPFARWDNERVAAWIHVIGLSMYMGECKRWVKNGDQLLKASQHDLEKELGMRNYFHRKKLQLALNSVSKPETKTKMDELDHNWVTRWLDDIGLPQYKDFFIEARIDGRMLHYLTVDDLGALKITNTLHHLSIKRAIQVLRQNQFNPSCLKRRPAPDERGPFTSCPNEVVLWTNHRVMEWLRTIDLSEYAPNLRGSGVHGALMVFEPRFSAELFATILSIPANKTLLRRHLNTHFVSLIGNDTQLKKRQMEATPGFIPLTPNQKVKMKKGLFRHKRTKSETDIDDLICPINMNGNAIEQAKDEKAAKEIGAYSQEINTLTNMLAKEQIFEDMPSSNV